MQDPVHFGPVCGLKTSIFGPKTGFTNSQADLLAMLKKVTQCYDLASTCCTIDFIIGLGSGSGSG